MRNITIAPGEYYHIYNRGADKQDIFFHHDDWSRFLFLILYLQSLVTFPHIHRLAKDILQSSVDVENDTLSEIIKHRYVELVSFCLMPNHFHLIVKEKIEGGIPAYMQRVLNSHTKYINTKYQRSGHLFEGPYKAVHIGDNNQLLYLSTYIHKNPRELSGWKNREMLYPWSSCQDYLQNNRWGKLLRPEIILDQFKNINEYLEFVRTSTAKMLEEEIDSVLL